MEPEMGREASSPSEPPGGAGRGVRRGGEGWNDWETQSELAAVGLKLWGLDWEWLEARPVGSGMRQGTEKWNGRWRKENNGWAQCPASETSQNRNGSIKKA
jgi:hypothetical protein